MSIERFDAHKGEDWAIMMMANAMRDEKDWVKPMWRPYFDAMMKLIAQRPDLYRMHGYSCRDIHFRNFKRTGKNNVRLVSCEAFWPQGEGRGISCKIRDGQIVEDFGCIPYDMPTSAYLERYGAKAAIIWPLVDVKRCNDIPADYPGPMCVPITFLNKIDSNDGKSGFLIVGKMHHGVLENGKRPFQKLIVINTALRARLAKPEGAR